MELSIGLFFGIIIGLVVGLAWMRLDYKSSLSDGLSPSKQAVINATVIFHGIKGLIRAIAGQISIWRK
jgi:hypothetical protein